MVSTSALHPCFLGELASGHLKAELGPPIHTLCQPMQTYPQVNTLPLWHMTACCQRRVPAPCCTLLHAWLGKSSPVEALQMMFPQQLCRHGPRSHALGLGGCSSHRAAQSLGNPHRFPGQAGKGRRGRPHLPVSQWPHNLVKNFPGSSSPKA